MQASGQAKDNRESKESRQKPSLNQSTDEPTHIYIGFIIRFSDFSFGTTFKPFTVIILEKPKYSVTIAVKMQQILEKVIKFFIYFFSVFNSAIVNAL